MPSRATIPSQAIAKREKVRCAPERRLAKSAMAKRAVAPRSAVEVRGTLQERSAQNRTAPRPVRSGASRRTRSVRMSPRLGCTSTRRRPASVASEGQMRPAMPSELSVPRAVEAMAMMIEVSARAMVRALESRSRPGRRRPMAGPPKSMAPAPNQRSVATREGFGRGVTRCRLGRRKAKASNVAHAQPSVCEVRVDAASGRAAEAAQRLAPTRSRRQKGHQRWALVCLVWLGVFRRRPLPLLQG